MNEKPIRNSAISSTFPTYVSTTKFLIFFSRFLTRIKNLHSYDFALFALFFSRCKVYYKKI